MADDGWLETLERGLHERTIGTREYLAASGLNAIARSPLAQLGRMAGLRKRTNPMADSYDVNKDRYIVPPVGSPSHPGRRGIPVTPSDTLDVTNASGDNAPCYAKSLYVGVSGNLAIVHAGDNGNAGAGTAVTYPNVQIGWFPMQVRRVMATNTTASSIIGAYDQ